MTRFASPASRDTAWLVAAVAAEIRHIDETKARRRSQLFDNDQSINPVMRLYSTEAMKERRDALDGVKSDPEKALVAFIERLLLTSASRPLTLPPRVDAVRSLRSEFPTCGAAVDLLENAVALANLGPRSSPQFTPMLMSGPPGVGKTEFSRRAAAVFGATLHRLQFAHATASFSLGGLDLQYSSGGPGWLARTMASSRTADPFVLLDEIDKVPADKSSDPLGALFTLWEDTASEFMDDALKVGMNLSAIRWIATCNDPGSINAALLSRCCLIEVAPPTLDQCRDIAGAIFAALVEDGGWGRHFDAMLADDVVDALAQGGPRAMKHRLRFALGRAAAARRSRLTVADLPRQGAGSRRIGFHS